jgi:hypothetical protein
VPSQQPAVSAQQNQLIKPELGCPVCQLVESNGKLVEKKE